MNVSSPKIPPVVIWLLTGALMWLSSWVVPAGGFELPASRVIAGSLALAGAGISVLGVTSFRRVATTVNPLRPAAASMLVVTGVYRVSRNPMYLGLLVVLIGWAVLLSNTVAFAWLPAFVLFMSRGQIAAEEVALEARFGIAFTTYRSKVRRWL